ncbi:MAG: hypothetical protein ACXWLH_06720 [Candidatus Saccharimonadales bacterium]
MTATNHALTGTAIGLILGQPILAIPLALLSHYICDMIPHFGTPNPDRDLKTKAFRNYLIIEAFICFLIVLGLAIFQPAHWQLAAICAFVAASPDLISAPRYLSLIKNTNWKPNLYTKFAHDIQWFEKPIGAVVEIAWLISVIMIILPFIR